MAVEVIIERIKKVEDDGQKKIAEAEAEKEQIIKKAREKAIAVVEEFEKTQDTIFNEVMQEARADITVQKEKIMVKGREGVESLQEMSSRNLRDASRFVFNELRKSILGK